MIELLIGNAVRPKGYAAVEAPPHASADPVLGRQYW
jgi:hypothetical protein